MKSCYKILITFVLFALTLSANADRGGFYYSKIQYYAEVHENNEWEVTEVYDIVFTEPRHGFYRYLPMYVYVDHDVTDEVDVTKVGDDGETEAKVERFKYRVDILDTSVKGSQCEETEEDDFYVFKIGDPYEEVTGKHRYIIHYKYVYPDDRRPGYDYLYHTILSTDFNEHIDSFYFKLKFDKPLPDDIVDRLEVYSGEYDDVGNALDVKCYASTEEVEGVAYDIAPNHGVTLYATLPADYFVGTKKVDYMWHYIFFGLTVFLLLAITIWAFNVKRGTVTKTIEFYPPEGISSAEVGYIIDESSDTIDIVSLIPWFASKGYITIQESNSGKKDLTLTKIKGLPGDAPEYQKKVMNLFFSDGDVVNLKDLGERPKTIENIKKSLGSHFEGDREILTLDSGFFLYFLLCITSYMTFATNCVVETWDSEQFFVMLFVWALPCVAGIFLRLIESSRDLYSSKLNKVVIFTLKFVVMIVVAIIYCATCIDYGAPMNDMTSFAMYVACFFVGELIGKFNVDTPYRLEMMGRLLGFKEFIKTAEKQRLESLQKDDPQYYYRVLPYAMVFGLTDRWSDLFKDIDVEKPNWYQSTSNLTGYAFTRNLTDNLCSTANSAITTISHDSSSHSSSGGGGYSGGGGGGGGGGSW